MTTDWIVNCGAYEEGDWTPVLTFGTPGDLSVSYAEQAGKYVRIGNFVNLNFDVAATPTYTTASGNLLITGAPFAPVTFHSLAASMYGPFGVTFPTGATMLMAEYLSSQDFRFGYTGPGAASGFVGTSEIPSGNNTHIRVSASFLTS